jgi:hypothetical protein
MKQTIGLSQFQDAFNAIRPNNFSYEGLEILYNYFEDYDENMELDVIAICCDWSEMTPKEIAESYGYDIEDDGNEMKNVLDCLFDDTTIIGQTDTTIIFFNF